jgi:hypothetical protein
MADYERLTGAFKKADGLYKQALESGDEAAAEKYRADAQTFATRIKEMQLE